MLELAAVQLSNCISYSPSCHSNFEVHWRKLPAAIAIAVQGSVPVWNAFAAVAMVLVVHAVVVAVEHEEYDSAAAVVVAVGDDAECGSLTGYGPLTKLEKE